MPKYLVVVLIFRESIAETQIVLYLSVASSSKSIILYYIYIVLVTLFIFTKVN